MRFEVQNATKFLYAVSSFSSMVPNPKKASSKSNILKWSDGYTPGGWWCKFQSLRRPVGAPSKNDRKLIMNCNGFNIDWYQFQRCQFKISHYQTIKDTKCQGPTVCSKENSQVQGMHCAPLDLPRMEATNRQQRTLGKNATCFRHKIQYPNINTKTSLFVYVQHQISE